MHRAGRSTRADDAHLGPNPYTSTDVRDDRRTPPPGTARGPIGQTDGAAALVGCERRIPAPTPP